MKMGKSTKSTSFFRARYISIRGYLYRKTNLIFVLYVILVLSIGTFIYSEIGKITKNSVEEQFLHRQTVMARMGAKRIRDYFSEKEKELLFLATISTVKDMYLGDSLDKILMDNVKNRIAPLVDVIRVDSKGIAQSTAPGPLSDRVNLADRDYYIWSQDPQHKGKIYYSEIVEARGGLQKGEKILIMATPVWKEDEYRGLVAYTISVQEIGEVFVGDMQLSNYSSPFLIDSKGNMLFHNCEELEFVNMFEYIDTYHWKGEDKYLDFLNKAILGEEQKTHFFLRESNGKVVREIVVSVPVSLADSRINWTIGISITDIDINIFLEPLYQLQVWILVYFMVSILGLVFIGIFVSRIRVKNSFFDGSTKERKN